MPRDRHFVRVRRCAGHDYTRPAFYFVTTCIARNAPRLGTVHETGVCLSLAGRIVDAAWRDIVIRFPGTVLDAYVIMPDHLHGLVVPNVHDADGAPVSVSTIIGWFKQRATREINHVLQTPRVVRWQAGFYDRIVRAPADIEHVRRYIANNPRVAHARLTASRPP